jgi:hypothetical protein
VLIDDITVANVVLIEDDAVALAIINPGDVGS